jgi:hypothetical protein
MGLPQAIQGKLIFLTAKRLQFPADLVIQVKGVSHDCGRDMVLMKQLQQPPEVRVQDRISAGQIEIRKSAVYFAEIETVIERVLHLLPGHAAWLSAWIAGENIAMLAPLIAFIRDVPLKRKILLHVVTLRFYGIGRPE